MPSLYFTPFEALKDLKINLKEKKEEPQKRATAPVSGPSQDKKNEKTDRELFLEAMTGVREIKEFSGAFEEAGASGPAKRGLPDGPKAQEQDPAALLEELVSGKKKIVLEQTGEYMEWTAPGATPDIARRLHRGEFAIREYIDLHGLDRQEAFDALCLFFREAIRKKAPCVKVIHGRGLRSPGGPVLKEALCRWLQGPFRKHVLAYASARNCDGGLGATYVILKQAVGTKRFA